MKKRERERKGFSLPSLSHVRVMWDLLERERENDNKKIIRTS